MTIISAQFTESGMILVNNKMHVPDTEHDRERWGISDWIAEGNTIAPNVPPAKSTIPPSAEMIQALWKKERGDPTAFNGLDTKVGF